jgi:flagella basal body P-ring formation protein FlgA
MAIVLAAPALSGLAAPAIAADAWYATHTLMPGDIVQPDDVVTRTPPRPLPDLLPPDRAVVGLEVKRRIYADRALTDRDVGPRNAVKANTPVTVLFKAGALVLELQGRALESGALGDEVRVLNTDSSRTVRGVVTGDGMVELRGVP